MANMEGKRIVSLLVLSALLICGMSQYVIYDVYGEPPNSVAGWTYNSCTAPTYTYDCAGQTIIGGYHVFGTGAWAIKTYSGLPGHNTITLQWDAYYIDSWDGTTGGSSSTPPWYDSYIVYADGTLIYWNIYEMGTNSNVNVCGNPGWPDWITTVTLTFSHNSSTIELNFTTGLNQACTDEEFGFKNIIIAVDVICTPACATCFGNDITQCYSCNSGWYLYGTTCMNPCPNSYYGDSSNHLCEPCETTCATCSAGTASDCTSCYANTYLNLPPTGSCTSNCPSAGYYPDSTSWECKPCYQSSTDPFTCSTCNGPANNDCTSCSGSTFLFPLSTGQCLNPCPNLYYGDTSTNTCQPCYSSNVNPYSCMACVGPYNYSCTTCGTSPTQYLFPTSPSGQCVDTCPSGYYGDNSNYYCMRCYQNSAGNPYSCLSCTSSSSSSCTSCISGTFLSGGKCITPCSPGTWQDSSTNTCNTCYQDTSGPQFSCSTCNGGTNSDCLSCNAGAYLTPIPVGQCLASCPDGYWPNSGTNKCQICYQNTVSPALSCLTCNGGTSNDCLSCGSEAYLSAGSCVSQCSSTQWDDPMTRECQNCFQSTTGPSYSCLTCVGGSSARCSSCSTGSYLYPALVGSCIETCPAGYYGDDGTNTCQLCAQNPSNLQLSCVTCSGAGLSSCLSCNGGAYLYPSTGGTCSTSCPPGFWAYNSTNTCQLCYQSTMQPYSCATCSGWSFTDCLTCSAPYFLDVNNNSCISACPNGYWGDTSNNICQPCYSTASAANGACQTCIGASSNQCTSCFDGWFYLNTTSTCVSSCPTGWYPNQTNSSCGPCFATSSTQNTSRSCATCVGPKYYECLACPTNTWFYANQCLSVCPDGTYSNSSTQICVPCYKSSSAADSFQSCLTCSGNLSSNCLTCSSGNYLFPPQMSCVTSCPTTLWYPRSNNTCAQCFASSSSSQSFTPQSCLSCSGPSSTNCNSCFPKTYFWAANNSCIINCPNGFYTNNSIWTCISCSVQSIQQSYADACAKNFSWGIAAAALIAAGSVASLSISLISAGANPGAIFLSNFMSVVTIYIYINVDFPSNFVDFVLGLQVNSFIPKPFAFMRDPNSLVAATNGKFAYWLTDTVFLENCGFYVAQNLAILFLITVMSAVTAICNVHSKTYVRIKYFRDLIRWNVFLSSYIGDFPLMLIFTLLHLIENNNPGPYADFSLFIAVLCLLSYAGLFMLFVFELNHKKPQNYISTTQHSNRTFDLRQSGKAPEKNVLPNKKIDWIEIPQSINTITEGYESTSWFSRNFLVLSMIQDLQTILLITLIQFSGLTQAVVYTLIALVYLIIFLKYRPMKGRAVSLMIFFNQLIKPLMGALAVYLGLEPLLPSGIPLNTKQTIGEILIITITVTAGLNVLIGMWFILVEIFNAIQKRRKIKKSVPNSKAIQGTENVSSQNKNDQTFAETDQSQNNTFVDMKSNMHLRSNQLSSKFNRLSTNPSRIPTNTSNNQTDGLNLLTNVTGTTNTTQINEQDSETKLNSLKYHEDSLEGFKGYQRGLDLGLKFKKKPAPQFDYPKIVLGKKQ